MDKLFCPFCGTDKLKFFSRIAGGYNRYYIGQYHCLRCGARSPIVRSAKMDYREHLTEIEKTALQINAATLFRYFQNVKQEKEEGDLL